MEELVEGFKVPPLPLRKPLIGPSLPEETLTNTTPLSTSLVIIDESNSSENACNTSTTIDSRPIVPQENVFPEHHEEEVAPDLKLAYTEPQWSGKPESNLYQLLVVKNGVEVDSIKLSDKCYYVCGRLPTCDLHLQHPSISRYHAILQYRPEKDTATHNEATTIFSTVPREAGFYLYDLSSTHGTYLTKNRLQPRCYYRMRVGQSVKFGGSSRTFVLDLKCDNSQQVIEAEAADEINEITQRRNEYDEYVKNATKEVERQKQEQDDLGATWGMITDDIVDDTDTVLQIDPIKEDYYNDDPKKALKTFFDREGLELEYESDETGPNHSKTYTIKIWLPIYTATGEPIYATASVKGNKKQAVSESALEACRLLDAEGILRQSEHSGKRKRKALEENDYYDSDEDNYFDRTGEVEKKQKRRMVRAGKIPESIETYQSLSEKLSSVQEELQNVRNQLNKHKKFTPSTTIDSLDDYMKVVSSQFDNATISKMKFKMHQLQNDERKLLKLVKIAAPCKLPVLAVSNTAVKQEDLKNVSSFEHECEMNTSLLSIDNVHVLLPDPKQIRNESNEKEASLIKTNQMPSLADAEVDLKKSHGLFVPGKSKKDKHSYSMVETMKVLRPKRQINTPIQRNPKVHLDGDDDSNFASWIPPEDQTGDGRTQLNEKLGY